MCPRASRRLLGHRGKAAKRPWKEQDGGREWRRPSSASASWDYWPGSWKASPHAQANKAKFPTYDRSWDQEESIAVVREERVAEAPAGEDGIARLAQQAVNTLRKAEQRVARIGRDQKEKKARFLAYERQIQAAHAEEEKRHQAAQERLANELVEAVQQQDAAKENLAKTMEALFGGRAAMDVTQERSEATAAWIRMQQRNPQPQSVPSPAMDPELLEIMRQYKAGHLVLRGPPPGLATRPASEGSRMSAPEGWPAGNTLPHGPLPVQPTYGTIPQTGQTRQAPFVPNSPHPLRTDLDPTATAAPGTVVDLRGPSEPFPAPTGERPSGPPADYGHAGSARICRVQQAMVRPTRLSVPWNCLYQGILLLPLLPRC